MCFVCLFRRKEYFISFLCLFVFFFCSLVGFVSFHKFVRYKLVYWDFDFPFWTEPYDDPLSIFDIPIVFDISRQKMVIIATPMLKYNSSPLNSNRTKQYNIGVSVTMLQMTVFNSVAKLGFCNTGSTFLNRLPVKKSPCL